MDSTNNRRAYEESMRDLLASWIDDVEGLRERALANPRRDYAAEIEALEYQFEKFYARLDQLEAVDDAVFDEWRGEVDEAAAELGRTIDRLRAELGQV